MINIYPVLHNKRQYLDPLLLADERESMIDYYPECSEMLALADAGDIRVAYAVTREAEDVFEIKNIATHPQCQRQGYSRMLMEYLFKRYVDKRRTMLVGTGDSPLTASFYGSYGFTYSHRIPDFFTDNYSHPVYEAGRQLRDMIYPKHSMNE